MSFFSNTNPIALFAAFIFLVVATKVILGRFEWFSKNSSYTLPIMIVVGVLALFFLPILKVISLSMPLIVLIFLAFLGIAIMYYVFGMPQSKIVSSMKASGFIRLTVYILIACAIMFGFSQLWGSSLLEDQSVSIGDAISPHKTAEVDFAPLFTKQALGMIMFVVIIGMLFVFVNMAK